PYASPSGRHERTVSDPTLSPDLPGKTGSILILKLSSLGDLFHALPAVRQLKEATGARIDWVTQSEYADLVRCFPDVDRVIAFRRRGGISGFIPFLRELRKERYDLAVDLQGLLKSALPARLARARRVIGPSYRREGTRIFYSAVAGVRNKNRHAVEEAMDVVRFLGCPEREPEFHLQFPKESRSETGIRIALIPFSRWTTKNWAPGHFVQLARGLHEQIPSTFYIVGGASDQKAGTALAKEMKGLSVVSCCGRFSLPQTGSLLQDMDLVISVDSGPMHMAAALGVPVLALFGPTDPARTGPFGEKHRVFWAEGLSCRPCFSDTCERGDHACMERIYPSRIIETAVDMLKFVPRDRTGSTRNMGPVKNPSLTSSPMDGSIVLL
ncbi:MAG: glycosyltransferase family 9 protein, partial [Kiritimatiellia bacterium]|nr:glycosyltransferase family 9 protein [Kiritimatiellia bacterium]